MLLRAQNGEMDAVEPFCLDRLKKDNETKLLVLEAMDEATSVNSAGLKPKNADPMAGIRAKQPPPICCKDTSKVSCIQYCGSRVFRPSPATRAGTDRSSSWIGRIAS